MESGRYEKEAFKDGRKTRVDVIFITLGVAALLPWNMFITANDYFVDYKLNVTDEHGNIPNYKKYFLSYVGVASKLPNVFSQALNIFIPETCISMTGRVVATTVLEVLLFLETVVFAFVDSTSWPGTFFAVTIITVILLNVANGINQSSIYGLASTLPAHFTNRVVTGMNVSGIVSAVAMIVSIAVSPGPQTAAICYFSTAIVILLLALVFCWLLPRSEYYMSHVHVRAQEDGPDELRPINLEGKTQETATIKWIRGTRPCWIQCLNVFLVFFVSLCVFPAVLANIEPQRNVVNRAYFSPIFCFLSFNLFATFGNVLVTYVPSVPKDYLWIPVVLRVLFVPLFVLCNYDPNERSLVVFFDNDYVYIIGVVLFALSSGYLSSLGMMYASRSVTREYASTAGMLSSFSLIAGILAGINFSFIFPSVIKWGRI